MSRRYKPLTAPKSKADIAAQLRWLAEHAEDVATSLDYFGGFAHWSAKGERLAVTAKILREWAHEIATEASK